jgi:hypothetical protein
MMRAQTRLMGAVLVGAVLLVAGHVRAAGLSSRVSLAGIQAIGQVIVTMSTASNGAETEIKELIERRLESAGIAIDPTLDTRLVAEVEVMRDTSQAGQRHYTYVISLSLQEPVRTTRAPRSNLRAKTWSSKGRIERFNAEVAFVKVLDAMEDNVNVFLGKVAGDTAAWKAASPDAAQ